MREYIIRKDDGLKVKLVFSIYGSFQDVRFSCDISYCEKRKRTYVNIINTDDYSWRGLNNSEKREFKINERRKYISDYDFETYLNNFIQDIKPNINEVM